VYAGVLKSHTRRLVDCIYYDSIYPILVSAWMENDLDTVEVGLHYSAYFDARLVDCIDDCKSYIHYVH